MGPHEIVLPVLFLPQHPQLLTNLDANLLLRSSNIYLSANYAKHIGISLTTRILSLVSGKK